MMVKFLKFELWMLILGFAAGIGFLYLVPWDQWEFVSKVSGTPIQLIYDTYSPGFYTFYVKTSDDLVYSCEISGKENSCIRVDTDTLLPDNVSLHDGDPISAPPPVPGKVTTSLVITGGVHGGTIEVHMIGLEDGSIWKWEKQHTLMAGLAPVYAGGIGSLIALVLGALIFAIRTPFHEPKMKNDAKHS